MYFCCWNIILGIEGSSDEINIIMVIKSYKVNDGVG